MDHLPTVQNPALPLLEVPYLCAGLQYDLGNFPDYPDRRNFNVSQLEERLKGNVTATDKQWAETACFLQSWLYFGLIHEFYKGIIHPYTKDFFEGGFVRKNEGGQRVITTARFLRFLDIWVYWSKKGRAEAPHVRLLFNRACERALAITKHYVELVPTGNILEDIPAAPQMPQQVQDILLSITVLHLTLLNALSYAEDQTDGLMVDMPHILGSPFVTQRLLRAKWCPRLISQLSTHLAPLDLLYAGQIRRNGPEEDHRLCSARECIHSRVNEETYLTKHVPYCRGCSPLSVNEDDIAACLAKDSYPLVVLEIAYNAAGQSKPRLKVVSRIEGLPYVAFSHVWSDGLGNPYSNSLPTCQVMRLSETLSDLSSQVPSAADLAQMTPEEIRKVAKWNKLRDNGEQEVLFWIDTLCIPVSRDAKQKALKKLQQTFTSAQAVVVLDAEIQDTSWQTPILENLMRIRMSKWMSRLWTLEEAILAPASSLYVLFEGGMFDLNEEMEENRRNEDEDHFLHRAIQLNTFRIFGRILKIKSVPTTSKITELGHLMVTRSTTKKGDETLITATILGLDIGVLFDTPVEERTQNLLFLQRFWPLHIMFNSMTNRMTEPGYRWAPKSFLGNGISPFMLGSGDLSFDPAITGEQIAPKTIQLDDGPLETDGGFLIPLTGFRIRIPALPVGEQALRPDGTMTHFWFFDLNEKAWYGVRYVQYENDPPWSSLRTAPASQSGRRAKLSIVLSANVPDGRHCRAALVAVYGAGDDGGVLYSEFRCLLTVFRASVSTLESSFSGLMGIEAGRGVAPSIDAQLPVKRELCEEVLADLWDGEDTVEDKLAVETGAVDKFRGMICSGWKVRDGQKWCIG